jgi:hypothetical protein
MKNYDDIPFPVLVVGAVLGGALVIATILAAAAPAAPPAPKPTALVAGPADPADIAQAYKLCERLLAHVAHVSRCQPFVGERQVKFDLYMEPSELRNMNATRQYMSCKVYESDFAKFEFIEAWQAQGPFNICTLPRK